MRISDWSSDVCSSDLAGLLRRALTWAAVAGVWCVIAFGGVLAWYAYDLPELGEIEKMTRRPNVTLLAADGTRLASFGDRFGATYSLRELPPHLPRAAIGSASCRDRVCQYV